MEHSESQITINNNLKNSSTHKLYTSIFIALIIVFSIIAGFIGYSMGSDNQKIKPQEVAFKLNKSKPTDSPSVIETKFSDTNIINEVQIANIKSNENWSLVTLGNENDSCIYDLYLYNNEAYGSTLIGHPYCNGFKNNINFSPDGSLVVYVNYEDKKEEIDKLNISVYSTAESKVIHKIPFKEILTPLTVSDKKALYYISVSPDNSKIALSYGYGLQADYSSDIIIIDLKSGTNKILTQQGLVIQWKNNALLQVEVPEDEVYSGPRYTTTKIKEVTVL